MPPTSRYIAIFVDFENLFYFLKNEFGDGQEASDALMKMLSKLRQELSSSFNEETIVFEAYADFERIPENVQSALYLIGAEAHYVLGTDHKNAADMQLCIDVLKVFYTRTEIATFVLVGGDRDYIPLIKHLQRHAKTVRVVAFPRQVSGDLKTIVGESFFLDATKFMPQTKKKAEPEKKVAPPGAPKKPAAAPMRLDDDEITALRLMFEHFPGKTEIWMTPFLHKLRAELSLLDESERKSLVSGMAEAGAIRVEKRQGETHDYSVILLNWNHPDVQKANGGS